MWSYVFPNSAGRPSACFLHSCSSPAMTQCVLGRPTRFLRGRMGTAVPSSNTLLRIGSSPSVLSTCKSSRSRRRSHCLLNGCSVFCFCSLFPMFSFRLASSSRNLLGFRSVDECALVFQNLSQRSVKQGVYFVEVSAGKPHRWCGVQ